MHIEGIKKQCQIISEELLIEIVINISLIIAKQTFF